MLLRFDDSDPGMVSAPRRRRGGTEINLSTVVTAVRRHKFMSVAAILAALALGMFYLATTPSTYRAAIEVMIGEEVAAVANGFDRPSALAQNEVMLENALRVLGSQNLAIAVVNETDLHEHPAFTDPEQSLVVQAIRNLRSVAAAVVGGEGTQPDAPLSPEVADMQLRMEAADSLRDEIEVRREGRSSVFSVRYTSTDPALAAAIVNAYGEAFVSDQLIGNVEASARVLDWLRDRLLVIQDLSREAALKAEEFRAQRGLLTISGESLTVQTISQLNADLAGATVELARMQALSGVYAEVRNLDPVLFVESGAAGASVPDAEFSAREERLMTLLQRKEEAERLHGPDHPQVAELRDSIETEGRALQREVQRLHETSLNAVRALQAEVAMLRNSIDEISAENLQLATARVELQSLQRQAEIYDALNETYLLRMTDLEQTLTFPVTNVRVLSMAEVPEQAVAPMKSQVMGVMLVLGAMAGGGLALMRETRQSVIRTKEDLQEATGRPFLGYLPMMTQADMEGPSEPLNVKRWSSTSDVPRQSFKYPFVALKRPRSLFAETLRNIRVACETSADGQPGFVLGVVSVRPGEGKTTVAANLAALVAASGRSVLLVDADVRTSGLSRRFSQSMGIGLREVLVDGNCWQDGLRREAVTGMNFLPSTFAPDDPVAGDLVGSPVFRTMLNDARKQHELTIIDLAPLGPVSDARALYPALDGLVMVLEWGKMPRELLQDVLSGDPALYEKLIGTTLNKTNMTVLAKYTRIEAPGGYYDV